MKVLIIGIFPETANSKAIDQWVSEKLTDETKVVVDNCLKRAIKKFLLAKLFLTDIRSMSRAHKI
jgi:hypothetical protein